MDNQELNVLNLKQEDKPVEYNKLEGTGVKALRILSTILIVLGVILIFVGIIVLANASDYHPEEKIIGILCISAAIICLISSPFCKAFATIAEAAKIYKDKNSQ